MLELLNLNMLDYSLIEYRVEQLMPVSQARSHPVPGVIVDFLQDDTTSYRL